MQVQHTLSRADGSEVRITATAFFTPGQHRSVDVYVHHRPSAQAPWALANDRPSPGWKGMPLAEYERHGRAEMLRVAKPGEILKVIQMLPPSIC